MAGPGVLLCSAPSLGTPLHCVCLCVCVCMCMSSSHGGFRSCEKGAVQDPVLQKGREGRGAVGRRYPPLTACSFGLPLGKRPPSTILHWDFRSFIASLCLSFPTICSYFLSVSPSLLKSISWQLLYLHCFPCFAVDGERWLKKKRLCVFLVYLC